MYIFKKNVTLFALERLDLILAANYVPLFIVFSRSQVQASHKYALIRSTLREIDALVQLINILNSVSICIYMTDHAHFVLHRI